MKIHVVPKGCSLGTADERVLERRIARLQRRLGHFDPDLVELDVVIEKQPRRQTYTGSIRLSVMGQTLPARRNAAPRIRTLIREAFEDVERELDAFNAGLRSEAAWRRRRGRRGNGAGARDAFAREERELIEQRAMLDRALAGDRGAFDALADTTLPGVRRVIFDTLSRGGHEPGNKELTEALITTLSAAFRRLGEKPDGWTLYGWIAQVAREELRGRIPQKAV